MIMCELTSLFGDHAEINASLVMTARAAFPDDPVCFIATRRQCEAVGNELTHYGVSHVFFEELPDRPASSRTQLIRTVRTVFRACRKHHCKRILIGGFDRRYHDIFSLFMPRWFRGRCYGLVHHQGVYLLPGKNSSRLRALKSRLTSLLWSDRIRVLVLGPSVADYLSAHSRYPDVRIGWVYHPYFYGDGGDKQPLDSGNIQFAFLGRTAREKGFDIFYRIASEIMDKPGSANCRFTLIGGMHWQPDGYTENGPVVRVKQEKWRLAREDLVSELRKASYLVMPYDRTNYGKTNVSGTLYDSIKYLKPIIALNNPELAHFFGKFGDLGYLCETADEMKEVIIDITETPPSERYSKQQECLLEARNFLHHDKQKNVFRALWEE